MNTPMNTPNGTIVTIVSFSLSQRIGTAIRIKKFWKGWKIECVLILIR